MVKTPMIGLRYKNGPWPKCLEMDGDDCCQYIESVAKEIDECVVVGENESVTEDFRTTRVRVFVDENRVVTKIPDKG